MSAIIALIPRMPRSGHGGRRPPADHRRKLEVDAGEGRHGAAGAEQADAVARPPGAWSRSGRTRGAPARACDCRRGRGRGPQARPSLRSRSARRRPTARSTRRGSCGLPSVWSTSTSSVDPPPMSKISAGPSPGSSNLWQPSTASRASSCGSMMSSRIPVSSLDAVDESPYHFWRGGRLRSPPTAPTTRCGDAICPRRSPTLRPRGPSLRRIIPRCATCPRPDGRSAKMHR